MSSRIKFGICGSDKKLHCKGMKEILKRLGAFEIDVVQMGEEIYNHKEAKDWPACDIFLCMVKKTSFPIDKAFEYCKIHKPLVVNDLVCQKELLSRLIFYKKLDMLSIPTPKFLYVPKEKQGDLIEAESYIQLGDFKMEKPFVEKPVDSSDHNIIIYYNTTINSTKNSEETEKNSGNRNNYGQCHLFRKINNKSSEFSKETRVRRVGSYLYEEYLESLNNLDIKTYVVGDDYILALGRKSPEVLTFFFFFF